MKTSFIVFFSFAFTATLHAQSFVSKVYGGSGYDDPKVIRQAPDSGFFIGGSSTSYYTGSGGSDAYVVRTNKDGDTLWTLSFGTPNGDLLYDLLSLQDGSCIATGIENLAMAVVHQAYVCKISSNGQLLWSKVLGSPAEGMEESHLLALPNEGFLVSGTISTISYGLNGLLCCMDSSGNVIWGNSYGTGGSLNEWFTRARKTNDGGFIVAGKRAVTNVNTDLLLLKTDSAGTLQWVKFYGGSGDNYGTDVELCGSGYIVTGTTFPTGNIFTIRTNSLGDTLWTAGYGGTVNTEWSYQIQATNIGNYLLSGTAESFSPSPDAYLVEIDSTGQIQWSRCYGGSGWEEGWYTVPVFGGGYAIGARENTTTMANYNFWLIKTDSAGNGLTCLEYSPPTQRFNMSPSVYSLPLTIQSFSNTGSISFSSGKGGNILPYCMTTESDDYEMNPLQISLYPDPNEGEFHLSMTNANEGIELEVFNALGEKVLSEVLHPTDQTVRLKDPIPGIYFYRVISENEIHTGKFLVN